MEDVATMQSRQRKIDESHLGLLSVFHFVAAGLAVLGLVGLYGHYAMFRAVLSDPKMWQQQGAPPPPFEMFSALKWMYMIFAAGLVGTGVLNLLAGLFLRTKKRRAFTLAVAGINCLDMPLGTVLGVFTIVVLGRESVRDLYQRRTRNWDV